MPLLLSATSPLWPSIALSDLDRTLGDHAHCEKKAAATAMKLVADHPGDPERVRALARLAQEEQQHFLAVLVELQRRGGVLPPDDGDPYAQELLALVRHGRERLLDRLLVGALIEARSCERMQILAERLPDAELARLYRGLLAAEARHHQAYVDLARAVGLFEEAEIRGRLTEIAAHEATVIGKASSEPRLHS